MQFLAYPINLEAVNGPQDALRVSVSLGNFPPGATCMVWAARTPEVLSESTLVALAKGDIDIAAKRSRLDPDMTQRGPLAGLRQLRNAAFTPIPATPVGVVPIVLTAGLTATGLLFEAGYDMPLGSPSSPSWDTQFAATQERSDGPWFIAACALNADGTVSIARGGLGQPLEQAHLAAVFLSPSNGAPLKEVGDWLLLALRSILPIINARITAMGPGATGPGGTGTATTGPAGMVSPMTLGLIAYTEVVKPDVLFAAYVTPGLARENPDGISAPDRREQVCAFNIRLIAMNDDPVLNVQVLTQAGDTIATMLNTKHYRQGRLPSGNEFNQAFVDRQAFGRTQTGWDDAVDLTWSCEMVKIAAF